MYIDLHVHLRGTVRPARARQLARQAGREFDEGLLDEGGAFKWHDFSSFLKTYDRVASLVQDAATLEEVAYGYLKESAELGAIYVELMLSPPDLMRQGVPFHDQISALNSAWERSRSDFGIESRLIVTCVRHSGPDAAMEAARLVAENQHPYIAGFGLTGDERQYDINVFAPAFRVAKDAGLRLTAHAGEHMPASTIVEAVEVLGLHRVGHGVRAVEDKSVVSYLARNRIGLEICISSNLALNLYRNLEEHPIRRLRDGGCLTALGSDDPAFFSSSPTNEYALAAAACSLDMEGLKRISSEAADMSFCDQETKKRLHEKIAIAEGGGIEPACH
ncbi:adenosine deaminase [Methylobacterium pseudosasicola]|uniref:Adenosine deaminase n=1 Tax=Methylobacterium pseudosasicola TaxID=582667 RepID=A0A1I4PSF4_9HYPH|nr:adenosine deaminase [Methylobacterium pseudosasicola]SFM30654.1 adenosine deaminase [Methylobacterium pseudosasicola]